MSTLDAFGSYSTYFKVKKSVIDNATFRLHYRTTFGILLLCSMLATAHQFFGGPIDCMTEAPSGSAVNTYCWIHGTFTLYDKLNSSLVGSGSLSPGVGHKSFDKDGREIHIAYYQWVAFVLCFQALLCYFPHYLWSIAEGGKLKMLIQGLDGNYLFLEETLSDRRKDVASYILRTLHSHNSYIYKFIFCEFLNIVNIVGQLLLMDVFFDGEFSSYGSDVLSLIGTDNRIDPLSKIFPTITKCDFYFYGPSGTIQLFDSLCLLPINIINEKTYVFIWFWFIALLLWTLLHFLSRLITLASRYSRLLILHHYAASVNREDLNVVASKCRYGDWFLLIQIGKHINPAIYHDLLLDLRDKIDSKRADNAED